MSDDSQRPREIAVEIARSVRGDGDGPSRREVLGKTALAGGALMAVGGSGLAFGDQSSNGAGGSTASNHNGAFDDVEGTDVDVLNYALTLEHLEDVFYQEATEMFSEDDFMDADALQDVPEEQRSKVYEQVTVVGEHESAHVEVLTAAVEFLGGEPSPECTYEFGVESVGDFLELGATLENIGVSAYQGAAPFIESPDLLSAALSIHSVEARHAAMFNALTGESPFPEAFDPAMSQSEVLDAAGPLISECPDGGSNTDTPTGTETPTETPTGTEDGH